MPHFCKSCVAAHIVDPCLFLSSDNHTLNSSVPFNDEYPENDESQDLKTPNISLNSQINYDANQTYYKKNKHVRKKRKDPFEHKEQLVSSKIQKSEKILPGDKMEPVLFVKQEPGIENTDTDSEMGTNLAPQALDQTKGVSDQAVADADSSLDYQVDVQDPVNGECKFSQILDKQFFQRINCKYFVLGAQKNRLNETVLFSTHNIGNHFLLHTLN